jgi:hypothetical protein
MVKLLSNKLATRLGNTHTCSLLVAHCNGKGCASLEGTYLYNKHCRIDLKAKDLENFCDEQR